MTNEEEVEMNDTMKDELMKVSKKLIPVLVLAFTLLLAGGCSLPTGSNPSPKSSYEDDLASFIDAVEAIDPLPADPSAADIYTYAITVDTLAQVYGISAEDVTDAVTSQIADEEVRARILGVLDGSLCLMDLMVADTGMYQDTEEGIVVGLPLEEEIPVDSPVQTSGTPEIVDDGERVGMEFDDAEDYLIIPADPINDLTHNGTIEAWLKPTTNVGWAGIIHKGTEPDWSDEGYSFQYDGGKRLMLVMTSESGQMVVVHTQHILTVLEWSYVVATWDDDEVHLYVNGVDVVYKITDGLNPDTGTEISIAENYPFKSSEGDVVVGTQIPGNAWRFNGTMSDIKIYDRYMEESEVLENYGG
jgi:hypothetical protein